MKRRRVLAIGLDGFEESLGREWIAAGELPALAALRRRSACFLLDHAEAQRTGLAWEQVSSGLSPDAARRWSAVHFDRRSYAVWQEGTRQQPFPARLRARTVVFDAPYFDLLRAPHVDGVVGWGAHDPGIAFGARPLSLLEEFRERFGLYPAREWIYGHVWPSAERTRTMSEALAHAVDVRAAAGRWLLSRRLPEWDLALVVVSEPHSAIEAFWHGIDPSHPLHSLPSASPARSGLLTIHRAVDRLVGDLVGTFPDASVVVFSMGGMGPNHSDVASMVLLPELLYRHAFGRPCLHQPAAWSDVAAVMPPLDDSEEWARAVNANFPSRPPPLLRQRIRSFLPASWPRRSSSPGPTVVRPGLSWMPAARFQPYWRRMSAFALPSFYDGRVRLNLAGREGGGIVPLSRYEAACDQIEDLLRACRDPLTGDGVIDRIERVRARDPRELGETEADLVIVWKGATRTLDHPRLGRVGPIPFRRPGGHTGRFGMALACDDRLAVGDHGVRSSFDVVPTLIDLLGEGPIAGLSGTSLAAARERAA